MGQNTKSTRPGPPHTGRPHGRVHMTGLNRPEVNVHGRATWACPCRAQVKSNLEKATLEGF
ncbi:hypothetical protein F383_28965 [Gossypium arboreum]|uniref:Uncharacterized protein n=1 Tax=Gossypium arboreum TaxID=29729 RepID=A0A0B0PI16_GOSAR|nr:hypothetical protein F383_28965 [Gossypium arboreum]